MAQTTILATGTASATSSDSVVSSGAIVTLGMFVASGIIPGGDAANVMIATPGADVIVAALSVQRPAVQVVGPGTFRVLRQPCTASVGIFSVT